ncbi:ABC transporter substrate-binding protein [Ensifer adhaerens]|nr:ABC transporter substrate-binding protein [Ensifer adhaerens]MBZ7924818.1 ABC transporter substrate-binding protein [Ensifer adhaerens]
MALGLALGVSSPVLADNDTVTVVMHSNLRVLDPITNTAHITRDHGYMIYDVLVAQDSNLNPQPEMADWTVSEDGLVYVFTLRDGLLFHDNQPVKAKDAVASLRRWGKRDGGGQLLFDATETLEATDDRTITWKLKKPFPSLLEIVSKQSSVPAFIMPERIADTPADRPITEYVGSGPFKFVASEFQPGVSVTYEKFDGYVPRSEKPDGLAGGKAVHVKRVKWLSMPDAQTAINSLLTGEIDYIETVKADLLPLLESNPDIVLEQRKGLVFQTLGRLNFKYPPFDNIDIRRAALKALNQTDIQVALMGDPKYYTTCGAVLGCGMPLADETGSESLTGKGDIEGAKELLKKAGYDGTPVVLLQPTDNLSAAPQPIVAAQALRNVGFNVDMQSMDWQTLVTRRANMGKPAEGGWNMFITNFILPEVGSPLVSPMLNGRGDKAWFGWPDDPKLEQLRAAFAEAKTAEDRKNIAKQVQIHTLDEVIYIPLGQFSEVQARSSKLIEMNASAVPVFWGIRKTD